MQFFGSVRGLLVPTYTFLGINIPALSLTLVARSSVMFKKHLKTIPTYAVELAIIALMAIAVYVASSLLDVFEIMYREMAAFENDIGLQLDELFIVCIFLTFASSLFAMRRWREASTLLKERNATLNELCVAKEQAEIGQSLQKRISRQYVA